MRRAILIAAIALVAALAVGTASATPPPTTSTTTTQPPAPAAPTRGSILCEPNKVNADGPWTDWIAMGRNTQWIATAELGVSGIWPSLQFEASVDGQNPARGTLSGQGSVAAWDVATSRRHHAWPYVRFRCAVNDDGPSRIAWALEEGAFGA
jgi:hypothetical protein